MSNDISWSVSALKAESQPLSLPPVGFPYVCWLHMLHTLHSSCSAAVPGFWRMCMYLKTGSYHIAQVSPECEAILPLLWSAETIGMPQCDQLIPFFWFSSLQPTASWDLLYFSSLGEAAWEHNGKRAWVLMLEMCLHFSYSIYLWSCEATSKSFIS